MSDDLHFERIAGVEIAPDADLPFGKPFVAGQAGYIIHDRAIEEGYQAGIVAHFDWLRFQHLDTPIMANEKHFALMFKVFLPKGLTRRASELWRANFIAGWASVYLGLVREVPKEG